MNNIIIRFANINDIERIRKFIEDYWNKNHVFVKNIELFKYYHVFNDRVRFVLAEDIEEKKIYGICGYIQSNNVEKSDLWTVVWKTIKSSNVMLGVDILKFIKEKTGCRIISSCGINPKTAPIYNFLNCTVGKLKHYYRINDIDKYNIAVVNEKRIIETEKKVYSLKSITSFEELVDKFDIKKYENRKPFKDNSYIKYRYYEHPVYKYKIFGIDKNEKKFDSIIIGREICRNNSKILRIVDFIGLDNDLSGISYSIQELIDDNNYEYIDFYCHGICDDIMKKAGFTLKSDTDSNVIPNYFEPFECKNVEINFFTSDIDNFYMFKADGDQDRPNIIE